MTLTNQEKEEMFEKLDKIVKQSNFHFEEKSNMLQRLSSIETEMKLLTKAFDRLQCPNHIERLGELDTRIEKVRYSIMMSVLSFIVSASSIFIAMVKK